MVTVSAWLCLAMALVGNATEVQLPTLSGQVVDSTGIALPGVSVQATTTDRKTTQTTVTDGTGRYQFTGLPAGQYAVTFSMPNFADVRRRDVAVSASAPARVDVTMQLALNASVVVTGRASFRNLADLANPADSLVGIANAASDGAVTARQIEARPIMRAGEVLEAVPGVIISQHSGEGKANQYDLRGFNLDHGTDFSTTVAGVPVNLPSHAHGQGYLDLNFLIPELVTGVQFRKGPYSARDGDFSAAGSANVNYANALSQPIASVSLGQDGWARMLAAASPRIGRGTFLAAIELNRNDGPWTVPDDFRKVNAVLRYSGATGPQAFSVTGLLYDARWNATDQVPGRAIADGRISRFGAVDPTDGGHTSRYSIVGDFQRNSVSSLTRATAFASKYGLNLFSNFTFVLDDPEHGDQFEQADRRWVSGARLTHTRQIRWGSRLGEAVFGGEIRNDDIPVVGLYRTEGRVRLSTTREDDVRQTSVGAFAETELRWLPWLRTSVGLRIDGYRFAVRAGNPDQSGITSGHLLSPKAGAIFGPWKSTELYVNAGLGHHSNDARGTATSRDPVTGEPVEGATPLVRAKGAEVGFRTLAIPRMHSTVAFWRLDLASELVFVGDAGTTEASRPSSRYGVEWTNYIRLSSTVTIEADLAWSQSRFTDADPSGHLIPGAPGVVASAGLTADRPRGLFGSIRYRYFGARPLIENGSVTSESTGLVNGQIGYHLTPHIHLVLDGFNLLDASVSDVDYFYASRLPGEAPEGVSDIHTHPAPPRSFRLLFRVKF